MQRRRERRAREAVKGWLLVLPSLLFIGAFTVFPVLQAARSSFFLDNLSSPRPSFAGFENYRTLFADAVFRKVLANSLAFSFAVVPLSMAAALALALIVRRSFSRLRPILRFAWFHPTVVPLVAVANVWLFIYTPDYGLLDSALSLFGARGPNWLGDPVTVMPSLIVFYVWKQAGYFMIFFLAALEQISGEYYEAARLDGACGLTIFRRVTLPLLKPSILFVFLISCTASFKTVDHLVVMTRGGPDNASNLLLYYLYETAFSFWDLGKAAAMTMLLIALLLAVIVMSIRHFDRRIHYQGG